MICKTYIKLFSLVAARHHKKNPDDWVETLPSILSGPCSDNLLRQLKKYEKYHADVTNGKLERYLLDLYTDGFITGYDFGGKKSHQG